MYPCKRKVEENLTDERGEGNVTAEAEIEMIWPQTKKASSHQQLEEARNGPSLLPPKETQPH